MSTTRVRMNIEGSGELEDGTRYSRELNIIETSEREGVNTVTREITEERMEIAGEVCKVRVVRVNGERMEEEVEDPSVIDASRFERKWEEVNWRWARVLGYHVPGLSSKQDLDNQSQSGSAGSSGSGASGCCCTLL